MSRISGRKGKTEGRRSASNTYLQQLVLSRQWELCALRPGCGYCLAYWVLSETFHSHHLYFEPFFLSQGLVRVSVIAMRSRSGHLGHLGRGAAPAKRRVTKRVAVMLLGRIRHNPQGAVLSPRRRHIHSHPGCYCCHIRHRRDRNDWCRSTRSRSRSHSCHSYQLLSSIESRYRLLPSPCARGGSAEE